MIPRPPRSTLFPYPPLFRSGLDHIVPGGLTRCRELDVAPRHARLGVCDVERAAPGGGPQDRKSTRLNSSHANISYAVFCLKKKKKSTFSSDCNIGSITICIM